MRARCIKLSEGLMLSDIKNVEKNSFLVHFSKMIPSPVFTQAKLV